MLISLWLKKKGDTTLCDKVCQWLTTGQWFSPDTPVSSTNKSDRHDKTEILLKVALNTINQPPKKVIEGVGIYIFTDADINKLFKFEPDKSDRITIVADDLIGWWVCRIRVKLVKAEPPLCSE